MTSIHTKSFRVELKSDSEAGHRTARRILFHPDVLKTARVATGDVVLVVNNASSNEEKDFAVGVAWPSLRISEDCILVEISIWLTARLEERRDVTVYPLSGTKVPGLPSGVPSLAKTEQAGIIRLREVVDEDQKSALRIASASSAAKDGKKRQDWLNLLLREMLVDLKYICSSQLLQVSYEGVQRRFAVASITPLKNTGSEKTQGQDTKTLQSVDDRLVREMRELAIDGPALQPQKQKRPTLWLVDWDVSVSVLPAKPSTKGTIRTTEIQAAQEGHKPEVETLPHCSKSDAYASVGGLNKQIEDIRDLIELPLTRPDLFEHFGLKPPRGILLYGPPGTGKTHLARAIAASTKSSVLVINGPELSSAYHGETESKLRAVFKEAHRRSPCIVILDEVDALVPRRDDGGVGLGAGGEGGSAIGGGGEVERRVVATLLTILDGMESGEGLEEDGDDEDEEDEQAEENSKGQAVKGRVVVIGTTNRPNAIDPALRRPGRFDREIEIGVPDAEARLDILNVLLTKTPHDVTQEELRAFSSRAHGYVGADLNAVVREAGTIAIKRWLASKSFPSSSSSSSISDSVLPSADSTLSLTFSDLSASLSSVRPSALRSLFAELPPIRYTDIGGQAHVIEKLHEAVEWPLLHPEAFKRLGVKPPKGVLLYGPPGCSKTVLARACACESGLNFLAVKGPELLNKFVGESERAIREIFRKARSASPSIIFFDEIDALATTRMADNDGSTSSHEGVITSLLNEMDGVQELQGVTIIAATNRPETIDSALMRPGRFDYVLYVGPPDQAGREEILRIRIRKMIVDPNIDIVEIARVAEGCSGAEITALCQEAAMLTMRKDMNAPFVPQEAFVTAARTMKRQITPAVLQKFEQWRDRANESLT